jgi:hypothetical protein
MYKAQKHSGCHTTLRNDCHCILQARPPDVLAVVLSACWTTLQHFLRLVHVCFGEHCLCCRPCSNICATAATRRLGCYSRKHCCRQLLLPLQLADTPGCSKKSTKKDNIAPTRSSAAHVSVCIQRFQVTLESVPGHGPYRHHHLQPVTGRCTSR